MLVGPGQDPLSPAPEHSSTPDYFAARASSSSAPAGVETGEDDDAMIPTPRPSVIHDATKREASPAPALSTTIEPYTLLLPRAPHLMTVEELSTRLSGQAPTLLPVVMSLSRQLARARGQVASVERHRTAEVDALLSLLRDQAPSIAEATIERGPSAFARTLG